MSIFKKKLSKLLTGVLLVLLLPAALLLSGAALPGYYGESYYAELGEMYHRLENAKGKRLIVVGNSDVAFGLDGALLESLLREKGFVYTVCPFGLYAAVGTSAMLSLSQEHLREGDLVVLVCEPVSEALSSYFGATAFWKCAETAPELLSAVGRDRRSVLAGAYVPYLQERFRILLDGTPPAPEGAYAKAAFDGRCDMVFPRPGNIMPLGYDVSSPIDFSSVTVEDSFARQVAGYCAAARQRGAAVVASFSPVNASAVEDLSPQAVNTYFTAVNEALPCPVISDPNDYILESGWFYDTNLHLNSAGAVVRTCSLAQDILAYLGCYRPVERPLPEMPPSAAAPVEEDEGDNGLLTFTPVGDGAGWLVSGLTGEGAALETLTVGTVWEGKSVVGFTPDALAGAAALVELRIPASVASLPDGLFSACPRLERLVFSHRETLPAVGADLFDGAENARVFVPYADYPMYRDGRGCETNPWTDYLNRMVRY